MRPCAIVKRRTRRRRPNGASRRPGLPSISAGSREPRPPRRAPGARRRRRRAARGPGPARGRCGRRAARRRDRARRRARRSRRRGRRRGRRRRPRAGGRARPRGAGRAPCTRRRAAARQLPRRLRGALEDRRDVVEGHGEHVVQHEGQPLGGAQRVEHDEHREPDRVGEQRLLLGVGRVRAAAAGSGASASSGSSRRDVRVRSMSRRHAGDDRRQPAAEVVDGARVGAAEPQPRLLDGVVGLARRAEHPVGHRAQVGPVLLESLRQPVVRVHGSHHLVARRHLVDERESPAVTAPGACDCDPRGSIGKKRRPR